MSRKQVNIIVILAVAVVFIFIGLGFLGINGFGSTPKTEPTSGQAILTEVQQTGTVADLRTQDIVVGTGDTVVAGDTVVLSYVGVLPDGTVFDSTEKQGGKPLVFTVGQGQLIPGFERGVLGMQEGGRRLLAIPPVLGYGAQGKGPVPPNATLIFDVQLVKRIPVGTVVPPTTATPTAQGN